LPENLTSGGTNFTNFIAEKCSISSYFRSMTVISSKSATGSSNR